jgi:phage/conjugal plasmid C-4 type zinc finger TraR family protein
MDRVQKVNEAYEDAAFKNHFARAKSATPPLPVGERLCRDCDKPIPKARLKANPAATRCIACQTLAEKDGEDD